MDVIKIDPAWIEWVLWLGSAWMWWTAVTLLVVGVLLMFLPVYRRAWVVEVGLWLIVAGAFLTTISCLWTLSDTSWPAAALLAVVVVVYVGYWLMPSHRRIEVRTEALIRSQPQTVFFAATDLGEQLSLHSNLQELYVKGGGPLGLGSIVVSREKTRTKPVTGEAVVVEFDPPRRYRTRVLDAPPNQITLGFEPSSTGTRVWSEYLSLMSPAAALLLNGFRKSRIVRQELAYREQWFEAVRQEAARDPD